MQITDLGEPRMTRRTRPISPAEDFDIPATSDEYRVRVWSHRRHHWFGRWGWTTTVDYLSAWSEAGDQELLRPREWWSETQDEAVEDGLTVARAIHDTNDPDLPLVVHVGGRTVIDERVTA